MKFEEAKTKENLEKALQGEALAHMRYMIYASLLGKTSKSLEEEIIKIAHNEKEHWKVFAKLLFNEKYYDNEKNIQTAIDGENHECEKLYRSYAIDAYAEGYIEIGDKFSAIADIECRHHNDFETILAKVKKEKNEQDIWICSNCGYIHYGEEPPEECPVCNHPKNYFK